MENGTLGTFGTPMLCIVAMAFMVLKTAILVHAAHRNKSNVYIFNYYKSLLVTNKSTADKLTRAAMILDTGYLCVNLGISLHSC